MQRTGDAGARLFEVPKMRLTMLKHGKSTQVGIRSQWLQAGSKNDLHLQVPGL